MSFAQKEKWNRIYKQLQQGTPCEFLINHHYLLPSQGCALDLACGLGANAHFLYQKGLSVSAWDISDVAIQDLTTLNSDIDARIVDIEQSPPDPNSFDIIFVSYFLHRPLCPQIQSALKPGGVLFYQTFCADKLSTTGPSNPDYLLKNNELLSLFPDLQVLFYQEFSRQGNLQYGDRNTASLIARKPI